MKTSHLSFLALVGLFSFMLLAAPALAADPAFAEILEGPSNPTTSINAAFVIGGNISRYKYSLDGAVYSVPMIVSTPLHFSNLSDGPHTLHVLGRGSDGVWQDEAHPTKHYWLIDTTGPELTIQNASGNPTNDATPSLTMTFSDHGYKSDSPPLVKFSCDGVTWTDFELFSAQKENFAINSGAYECTVADGQKNVFAQAKDTLQNIGSVASTGTFTLDTLTPDLTLEMTSSSSPAQHKFTWSSADVSALFRYSIDYSETGVPSGAYGTAKSLTFNGLNQNFYFHVQAKDAAGNESAVKTVKAEDNFPPTAVLTNCPDSSTTATTIAVTVEGNDVVTYQYRLDSPNWSAAMPVAQPITATVSAGEHTLEVLALDEVGNIQTVSTKCNWTVTVVNVPAPQPSGGGGGGGGGGGAVWATTSLYNQTKVVGKEPKVLAAKKQLFPNGTVLKLKGKQKYYLIKGGKRMKISLFKFKKLYAKKTKAIEVTWKTLKQIPLLKKKKK